jgi:hypothetical protein
VAGPFRWAWLSLWFGYQRSGSGLSIPSASLARGARYTLAIMNHLGGEAGFRAGANTLTQVAAILFQGRQIPVPDVSATP